MKKQLRYLSPVSIIFLIIFISFILSDFIELNEYNNPDTTFKKKTGFSGNSRGSMNTHNHSPIAVHHLLQDHNLTRPTITYPTNNSILNGSVVIIQWVEAICSEGHDVFYSVFFTKDPGFWPKILETNIQRTNCTWDISKIAWTKYYIKVEATCSKGLTSESQVGPIYGRNILTDEQKIFLVCILFVILAIILSMPILWRKRAISGIGPLISPEQLKTLKLGLCLGSFTDTGLMVKVKNENCPFSLSRVQSMLDYSTVLDQHGKAESIYGPIPHTSLKEVNNFTEPLQTEWNYISYLTHVKDNTVEDLRIIKTGGVVPAKLLLFYPKQFDHLVLKKKNSIRDLFKSAIGENHSISDFTSNNLNQLEVKLLKAFEN